jgi:hypothetical protein
MAYCTSNTKAGKQCTAPQMSGSDYCYRHNPEIDQETKLQASKAGGKSKSVLKDAPKAQLRTIQGIVNLLETNTDAVIRGDLDPRVSNAVVQNVNALLKVYELAVVDSRVRKLEQEAGIDSPTELVELGAI